MSASGSPKGATAEDEWERKAENERNAIAAQKIADENRVEEERKAADAQRAADEAKAANETKATNETKAADEREADDKPAAKPLTPASEPETEPSEDESSEEEPPKEKSPKEKSPEEESPEENEPGCEYRTMMLQELLAQRPKRQEQGAEPEPEPNKRPPPQGIKTPITGDINEIVYYKTPLVIGVFGVSGCGKSTFLDELERQHGVMLYDYYEYTKVIRRSLLMGMPVFDKLPESDPRKARAYKDADQRIKHDCEKSGRSAIVVDDFTHWEEGPNQQTIAIPTLTKEKIQKFSVILYLYTPPRTIYTQRYNDRFDNNGNRKRPYKSEQEITFLQTAEMAALGLMCYENGVSFQIVRSPSHAKKVVSKVVQMKPMSFWDFLRTVFCGMVLGILFWVVVVPRLRDSAREEERYVRVEKQRRSWWMELLF